jgi:hypothetical protein
MSDITATETRAHHPYSPSTLQALEACPNYLSRSDVVHIRAIKGTIAHDVVEKRLDDQRLDDDDAMAAAECIDFYDQRLQMARTVAGARANEIIELKEEYLPIDAVTWTEGEAEIKGTTAGYIDAAIILPTQSYAEIFDWKFGKWAVENAENNLQGIAYALGLLRAYPTLQSVRFWFKQPYTNGLAHRVVRRSEIAQLYLRIQVIVEKARTARASGNFDMARPMVPNCNFCANLGKCTKVAEFACKVGAKFHPLAIPASITPSTLQDPANTRLGLELSQVMAAWAASFRQQVNDRVIRGGQPVPDGYELTERSDRETKDEAKFREVAIKHIPEEAYNKICKLPPLGKIEDIISDSAPRGEKGRAITNFREELLSQGAVEKGVPYTFLRAVSTKETKQKPNTNT